MNQKTDSLDFSLIPVPPVPAFAQDFSQRMHGLLNGQPKDEATVTKALEGMEAMFDLIAAKLYSLASMLVGEGEDSIILVEKAIATAEVSVCQDAVAARQGSRRALCTAALDFLAARDSAALRAPEGFVHVKTCIEDDDLDGAGVSRGELENLISGPDRERVKEWLAGLPLTLRIVFALRAVAGFTTAETAALLASHGGPRAGGWNTEAVREFFRQALCSLASQMIQATATR